MYPPMPKVAVGVPHAANLSRPVFMVPPALQPGGGGGGGGGGGAVIVIPVSVSVPEISIIIL